jgi:hypothetical protein
VESWDYTDEGWDWIGAIADSGEFLYVSHNLYNVDLLPLVEGGYQDTHDFKIAKIDRYTGEVLSDTPISGFLGQTFSQVNALEFHEGSLYAIENASSHSTLRGYALEILLDGNGDVAGTTVGAFIGNQYPDGGLDFHEGLWYATAWGYTPVPKREGSIVYTSPDIMNTAFTQVGTGNSAVQGIGMIDGWEFDSDGTLWAVSWYDPEPPYAVGDWPTAGDWIATEVFTVDLGTDPRQATFRYDLHDQLDPDITWLSGLSDVVNVAPSCGPIEVPDAPVQVGSIVEVSAAFTDPYDPGPHSATWDWGDGSSSEGTVVGGAVSGSHIYTTAGVYTIGLTLSDGAGAICECAATEYVVVYDPSAGFVTGGGWFDSPAGALAAVPGVTGKATFGFVSKYKNGASVPDGNTQFVFKAGDLNFSSSNYDWLVVTGSNFAKFKGRGTINGGMAPGGVPYAFQIWAGDGGNAGADTFRIKIWYEDGGTEVPVYDNGMSQPIGGGSIVVHTK